MKKYFRETPNHFSLPRRIQRLGELAYNMWWVWNPDAQRLFSQIDRPLWERIYHNPVASCAGSNGRSSMPPPMTATIWNCMTGYCAILTST
jgi:hypothetical protein